MDLSPFAAAPSVVYSFGPFVIHSDERLLRRGEDVVPLPPKLVATLLLLLERPNELVTKESLREKVWEGAFVEENTVTQTVSRLRRLFSPEFPGENPIIVVPKRGYRFGVGVQILASEQALVSATQLPHKVAAVVPAEGRTHPHWMVPVIVGLLLLLIVPVFRRVRRHKEVVAPAGRPAVAVLGFNDLSHQPEDAWVGTALSEMMYSELSADQKLRLVPNPVVSDLHRSMSLPQTISLPPQTLKMIGRSLNCDLVLVGQYLESGGKLRIDVMLEDTHTGETRISFTQTDDASHLLPLTAMLGTSLRRRLGQDNLPPQDTGQIVAAAATNPEALRAYAEGISQLRELNAISALPFLQHAIQLEPNYPLAHSALSQTWSLLGYEARASEEAHRALDLSTGLSRELQLAIEARGEETSMQWDKAANTESVLWKFFPDDIEYGLALTDTLISGGRAPAALQIVDALRRLPAPQNDDPRIALREAEAQSALAQYTSSVKAADRAIRESNARRQGFVLANALILHSKDESHLGDVKQAEADLAEAVKEAENSGDLSIKVRALHTDAELNRQHGNVEQAKKDNTAAIAIATQIGDRHDLVDVLLSMTQVYRPEGNFAMQKQYGDQALALARETANVSGEALALLDLGNILNNMGDPQAGANAYQQCATLARSMGNQLLLAQALGNLAIIDYTHGRLASAESLLEQGLLIRRAIGEKSSTAYALGHYATVLMYENRLPEARAALKEKCDIEAALGERLATYSCQVSMAELFLAEGHPDAAVVPLASVIANCKDFNPLLSAWETMAEAQLQLGNTTAARDAIDHSEQLGKSTKNPANFAIPMGLVIGRLQAATGNAAEGRRTLEQTLNAAAALKLLPIVLRAKLYLAEVDLKSNPVVGVREMKEVEAQASTSGFTRIAAMVVKHS